ncbi:fused MFS/spermidine synthase [Candidatus Gracilibacteria bacterium]|nr:fused MFS/spermidine synthase [Candidatus Gracilibacteria bacterium]
MRKILSYILPIRLKKYNSKINGQLNIYLVDGVKKLDTDKSNYSYGSLQKILHRGLVEISFPNGIERVLVLGLGGGSIVQTIRDDFNSEAYIDLVDIDPDMISIAINEFQINEFDNINIIQSDALDFLESSRDTFDLIIVDIFITDTIPAEFTRSHFIKMLIPHLNRDGRIIYNTMRKTMTGELLNTIKYLFSGEGLKVKILTNIEGSNDLIIAEK